ncbi:hypothetical protein ACOZ35_08800 [Halorubrum xinjiangense]|uniref:hypothetical protein n=1 Tax=Halorubrum xinjiangense TaxID=261291 RepID=UPI003C6EC613
MITDETGAVASSDDPTGFATVTDLDHVTDGVRPSSEDARIRVSVAPPDRALTDQNIFRK